MLGLNEIPFAGPARQVTSPAPRAPRVAPCYHRQCAWCLRLKHRDGTPHGHPWPRLSFYSAGICSPCKARLQRLQVRDVRSSPPSVASVGPDRAAA